MELIDIGLGIALVGLTLGCSTLTLCAEAWRNKHNEKKFKEWIRWAYYSLVSGCICGALGGVILVLNEILI